MTIFHGTRLFLIQQDVEGECFDRQPHDLKCIAFDPAKPFKQVGLLSDADYLKSGIDTLSNVYPVEDFRNAKIVYSATPEVDSEYGEECDGIVITAERIGVTGRNYGKLTQAELLAILQSKQLA